MIQTNELRIGNYVDLPDSPFVKVDLHFFRMFDRIAFSEDDIFPIPLTPELLQKCGFNNSQEYITAHSTGKITESVVTGIGYFGKISYKVYPIDSEWVLHRHIDEYEGWQVGTTFKYLHQLQNLIYALTGNELEINLDSHLITKNQ